MRGGAREKKLRSESLPHGAAQKRHHHFPPSFFCQTWLIFPPFSLHLRRQVPASQSKENPLFAFIVFRRLIQKFPVPSSSSRYLGPDIWRKKRMGSNLVPVAFLSLLPSFLSIFALSFFSRGGGGERGGDGGGGRACKGAANEKEASDEDRKEEKRGGDGEERKASSSDLHFQSPLRPQ